MHCGMPFIDSDCLLQHVIANHPLNQTGGDITHPPPQKVQEPEKNERPKRNVLILEKVL